MEIVNCNKCGEPFEIIPGWVGETCSSCKDKHYKEIDDFIVDHWDGLKDTGITPSDEVIERIVNEHN